MTASRTYNSTFTIVEARYVGAKIGADLRFLNAIYGRPILSSIDDYAEEAALLLRDGYLKTVDFGFRDADSGLWRLRLRYTATAGGQLLDSRPGSLPTGGKFDTCTWSSYLTHSAKWEMLTTAQQKEVESTLPIQRSGAVEPQLAAGTIAAGATYSRNGNGVTRDVSSAF